MLKRNAKCCCCELGLPVFAQKYDSCRISVHGLHMTSSYHVTTLIVSNALTSGASSGR